MAKFVTLKHIPLARVGQWGASTGPVTLTPDVFSSMIEAEPQIGRAVIKIGHRDPRFKNPVFDGEPVYGQISNLSQEGEVLYGDLVNVPSELAENMKSQYPNRSVEIAWNMSLKNALGQIKKTFKAALIGLALLGETEPAVVGMTPLSAGGYDMTAVSMLSTMVLTPDAVTVQDALRDAGVGLYADTREDLTLIQVTDNLVEFTTPTGTFRASYVKEDGIYLFSDTEAITRDFPQPILTITDADGVSTDGDPAAGKPTLEKEQAPMDFLKKLREKLGLPETATEDEVFAAANPAAQLSAPPPPPPPAPVVEAPKTLQISEAAFLEFQTNAAADHRELMELKGKIVKKDHDGMITDYLSEGRIHPTEEAYWRGQLDKDEAATVTFLSARTPVVPVSEIGSSFAPPTTVDELAKPEDFESALLQFGMRPTAN